MLSNQKLVKAIGISLALIVPLTVVYIYWTLEKSITGILLGIAIGFVAPTIGLLFAMKWMNKRK